MQRTVLIRLVCCVLGALALAGRAESREIEDPGKAERINALVERLASKNPAPTSRAGNLRVPVDYDKNAQVIVYLASQQLLAEGADAFDILIAHFKDDRYSYSYESPTGTFNTTVGKVCHRIMARCIECYEFELHLISRDQYAVYLFRNPDLDLSGWWKENRKRPLWEIQLDAIDHALRFMKSARRDKVNPPFAQGGQLPPEEFETLKKENVQILQAMKSSILATNEAFRPKSIEQEGGSMYLLPWPTRAIGK